MHGYGQAASEATRWATGGASWGLALLGLALLGLALLGQAS